jgi:anti-sigma factor RsiW
MMLPQESHLSDQELLMTVDGELPARDDRRVQSHLNACWHCRTRKQEIEAAIGKFIRIHRRTLDMRIPPAAGPRALLKARIAQLAEKQHISWSHWFRAISWKLSSAMFVACALGAMAYFVFHPWAGRSAEPVAVTVPNPSFTPGATVLVSSRQVCSQSNTKNKAVPAALQRRVFYEYGIQNAAPSSYEIDYLITPALGGADDIHNIWPQSNGGTVWNAQVKDALEDHLRYLVCDGQLDLATAQREIASNWIEAYKKYFHTDSPLSGFR